MPTTSLWYLDLSQDKNGNWIHRKIKYLSLFNKNSYNNQAFWMSKNEFLASIATLEKKDPDICLFDLSESIYTRILDHPLSHYSPRIHPLDSTELTVVEVNTLPDTTQYLAAYDLKTGKKRRMILSEHGKIGYYRFLTQKKWVCFIVDHYNYLAICNEENTSRIVFASDIGRCFEVLEDGSILFVHKLTKEVWQLKKYLPSTKSMEYLGEMPKGVEDFGLTKDGEIICAKGAELFKFDKIHSSWNLMIDLSEFGLNNIKRISILDNQFLLVNEP
ncbi:MAG: hypothetical protein IPM48_12835 [Saprospiraceae bacterium]|nr:hypothetical protein [Saprospiraceae bacterium]